jgi:hypothetical protein
MTRDPDELTTRLVAVAGSYVGMGEETDLSNGRLGQMVESFFRHVQQPADEPHGDWSAAFVNHVGYAAHYDQIAQRSAWPLPPLATCEQLRAYAEQQQMVVDEEPAFGDIFLQPTSRGVYIRAGIVVAVTGRGTQYDTGKPHYDCTVIEGNSSEAGEIGGPLVVVVTRRLCPALGDQFIRWAAQAASSAAGAEWLEAA